MGELVKKSDFEDGNTQTPAIENITGTQSIRDILALMKRSNFFFKLEEKENGKVFWNDVFNKPLGQNRIGIKNQEFDITPDIQAYFTNAKLTTKFLDNGGKETVFETLEIVGFNDNIPKIRLISARMKVALYYLPEAIAKSRNLSIPAIAN